MEKTTTYLLANDKSFCKLYFCIDAYFFANFIFETKMNIRIYSQMPTYR
jgi:hypothetical protein